MPYSEHFGDRLADAVKSKRSSVCVGLDPRLKSLPQTLLSGLNMQDPVAVATTVCTFCKEVIDAVADIVPIVKPQAAFFELLGPQGMASLAEVVRYASTKGLLVLMDGKRGDIGTTAEAYADAYLGAGARSPWGCDALTVNPYMGEETLEPFSDRAQMSGSGIFVLVKTSNPGSSFLQDLKVDDRTIYQRVAESVQRQALQTAGKYGYGIVGAVTGATYPAQLAELRKKMPNAWLLIPGYGAQGGSAADVRLGFDDQGLGAIVNSSRGILFAYAERPGSHARWQDAVRSAALHMTQELQG